MYVSIDTVPPIATFGPDPIDYSKLECTSVEILEDGHLVVMRGDEKYLAVAPDCWKGISVVGRVPSGGLAGGVDGERKT